MATAIVTPGLTGEQVYQERARQTQTTQTTTLTKPAHQSSPQQNHYCGEEYSKNGRVSTRQLPKEEDLVTRSEKAVRGIIAAVRDTKWETATKESWIFFQLSMNQIETHLDVVNRERQNMAQAIRTSPPTPPYTPSTSPRPPSWAELAKRPAQPVTTLPYPEKEDARKAKRVTVRIDDQEEKKQLMTTTLTQVVDTFRGAGGPAESIIAAHRTRGGDIVLQTTTIEAREQLEREGSWARKVCSSARILRQTTPVIIHGVRIAAVDEKDQGAAIEGIKGANRTLHPGLDIVKVEWPAYAHKLNEAGEKKKFSSLVVEVTSPEAANRLIEEGLAFEGAMLFCDSWVRNSTPHQCFNCYGYGHISRACKHPTRCGFCAENHATNDHEKVAPGAQKCATCGGKHPAWGRNCPIRQKEKTRVMAKVNAKPKYYRVPARTATNPPQPFQFKTTTKPAQGLDAEGFQLISSNKRKAQATNANRAPLTTPAKRGRPTTQAKLAEPEVGQKPMQPTRPRSQEPTTSAPTEDAEMSGGDPPPSTQ